MPEPVRRYIGGFTIDAPTAKDLDDAIMLREYADHYRVDVSIADVAHAVEKGTDIDRRARRLAFTRYFETDSNPMLPRELSEYQVSLLPRKKRNVIVFSIRLSRALDIEEVRADFGIFISPVKHSPYAIECALQNPSDPSHVMWKRYVAFAEALKRKRRTLAGGYVSSLITNEEGVVTGVLQEAYARPHMIVQEFMILANQALTQYVSRAGIPILYRNHAPPDAGTNLVGPALYEAEGKGHFGLNLPAYGHWTSPIRRYADLVNHRQLVSWLKGERLAYGEKELTKIGTHINAVREQFRTFVPRSYTDVDIEEVREASALHVAAFDAEKFSMAVRMLAHDKLALSETLTWALLRKLSARTLLPVDYAFILMSRRHDPAWRQLREEVLLELHGSPELSRDVIKTARDVLGWEVAVSVRKFLKGYETIITAERGHRSLASDRCMGVTEQESWRKAFASLIKSMYVQAHEPLGA